MKLCVIPARGGSKRIPRKNVRIFAGKPMIAWSIEASLRSGCFDRVIVSTDDDEIAEIAANWGADVPFRRPSALSDDVTPTAPVVTHAIEQLRSDGVEPKFVCCVYPAAPLIDEGDLREAYMRMISVSASSCFPVARFPSAPQRALQRDEAGLLSFMYPEHRSTRSQDLSPGFYDVGQFYWGTTGAWQREEISKGLGLELPSWRVVDIDNEEDLVRAELYFKFLLMNKKKINL